MNLLYLAAIDFPGPKARTIQIANTSHALALAGCRVTLVVGRRDGGPIDRQLADFGLAPHPNLRILRVPALRLPAWTPELLRPLYTRFWSWSYILVCLPLLAMLLREQPTLLVRNYRLAWILLGLRWLHRRPLVFEAHGLPSAELLDEVNPSPRQRRRAARLQELERAVFSGAAQILTITGCLRGQIVEQYGIPAERVAAVPDAGPNVAASRRLRSRTSRTGPSTLIYTGQLYPHKGVDLLIRALPMIESAALTIIGGLDNDPNLARLSQLATQLGVAERVRFLGSRPYAEVPDLLANADVALLPLADGLVARCFTSPLKLFDYLAAGCPIVAVDFPTVREILRDGENALLVAPNRPDLLAEAIERLLADPELADRLASRAREDAAQHTWERRAARIIAAIGVRPLPGAVGAR